MNNSRASHYRHLLLHSPLLILLFGLWIQVSALYDREHQIHNIAMQAAASSTDTDKQGTKTGQTTTASANYNSSNGNYIAVTDQTSITSDGKVNIDTKGNTHLAGALIEGETATSITTGTLTTEDIHNRANYNSMSVGASYTHSTSPDKAKDNGISPNIGLPQDIDKSSTTHTAIAENTQITITDSKNQTQDTDTISRDTEHASYTMTEINTEVLDIRADISKDLSKDGFKAVGDLAMREGWEDGSVEKTLAHAAMGAVVAAVGNGDALGGALGAGAAEAARPATADADEGTQQTVSAIVGAIAGGGTGASTGRDGEEYNRQLHQREIAWIKNHADAFAKEMKLSPEEAEHYLRMAALGMVDQEEAIKNSGNLQGYIGQHAIEYIKGHTVQEGATFTNEHEHYGMDLISPSDMNRPMFQATKSQYLDHDYNPNTDLGGLGVSPALEVLPIGKIKAGVQIEKQSLYRAVKDDELKSIQDSKAFINPIGTETKYFSTSKEGASDYAQQAYGKFGDTSSYTIIETKIPKSKVEDIDLVEHGVDGGIETIVLPTHKLPDLDQPIIHNSSSLKGNP